MFRVLLLAVSLLFNHFLYAEFDEPSIQSVQLFIRWDKDIDSLIDYTKKEEQVSVCVSEYIKRQSKSYTKIVQNNLYDMMRNFGNITSKIYGQKGKADEIPYNEKIRTLAIVQCDLYFNMGMLK